MALLPNPPTLVEFNCLRFLIFDAPNDDNIPLYMKELNKHRVKHVVRACEPTYSAQPLQDAGITVYDWKFPDGGAPPNEILKDWKQLVSDVFKNKNTNETIGIHCVAGLGRAPVLVAIALIEHGMEASDAIEYIRQRRRGAINASQLRFLRSYKSSAKCFVM